MRPGQNHLMNLKSVHRRVLYSFTLIIRSYMTFFLAVQNSSICDLVAHWLTDSLSDILILTLQSGSRDLWPLRHLIRVMRWHDQTNKSTYPHTYLSTYLPTYLSTYLREHPQGAILETCDLYDIWSEWWGDLTWPKKTTYLLPNYLPTCLPIYLPTYQP